jgi:hypothetical protein
MKMADIEPYSRFKRPLYPQHQFIIRAHKRGQGKFRKGTCHTQTIQDISTGV